MKAPAAIVAAMVGLTLAGYAAGAATPTATYDRVCVDAAGSVGGCADGRSETQWAVLRYANAQVFYRLACRGLAPGPRYNRRHINLRPERTLCTFDAPNGQAGDLTGHTLVTAVQSLKNRLRWTVTIALYLNAPAPPTTTTSP